MKRPILVLALAVAIIELTGLDGKVFYFPVDSVGPFRAQVGCPGTAIFTTEGSFCVADQPDEVAKKLKDLLDEE